MISTITLTLTLLFALYWAWARWTITPGYWLNVLVGVVIGAGLVSGLLLVSYGFWKVNPFAFGSLFACCFALARTFTGKARAAIAIFMALSVITLLIGQ